MLRMLGVMLAMVLLSQASTARAQACNKKLDSWEVKDPKAASTTRIEVWACDKLGLGKPGVQVKFVVGSLTSYCAVEPDYANKVACRGKNAPGQDTWLMEERSDTRGNGHFVKNSLVLKDGLKLRVEVKVQNNPNVTTREYKLPFNVDCAP